MAPITNITTAIIDALNQARAATDPSSPVNLTVNNINQVQPPTSPSGPFSNSLLISILTFFAALANIWLGLGGTGVIAIILFLVQCYKKGKWPQSPEEDQVELTREHVELTRELLEVTKRIEEGRFDYESSAKEHHDRQGRQMDLLLKHFSIKDRPCLHSNWEGHGAYCTPERNLNWRYDAWDWDSEKRDIDWSVFGSRENLIPFDSWSEQRTESGGEQRSGGAGLESDELVNSLPSGWIRVSESVVENQIVTDWGNHEKMVWLEGVEEGLAGLPLYHGTTKLKAS
ncbi:hypothetical protein NCU07599 [Neurospora crassa OR74A]|uniref:Uncharacterized protein n=1 Tax=Neurospora crassa (strain ATCC 24698 / 74-OR23-1A / CBS 708.71 / DSM 1257 / FGSC 987) TaxID=367110 RepID=Q7SBF7_NEUCR|nr:hypothetical protein NCU07599 [Neurospora crassa OR74A]EAA33743.1 hypothetical protein NCU07599 [Neurospora crassa OR74A]|eukprot:XP_962979.1 hypothetical protein NCU07599 [Neurospora crassa OR74A]